MVVITGPEVKRLRVIGWIILIRHLVVRGGVFTGFQISQKIICLTTVSVMAFEAVRLLAHMCRFCWRSHQFLNMALLAEFGSRTA